MADTAVGSLPMIPKKEKKHKAWFNFVVKDRGMKEGGGGMERGVGEWKGGGGGMERGVGEWKGGGDGERCGGMKGGGGDGERCGCQTLWKGELPIQQHDAAAGVNWWGKGRVLIEGICAWGRAHITR